MEAQKLLSLRSFKAGMEVGGGTVQGHRRLALSSALGSHHPAQRLGQCLEGERSCGWMTHGHFSLVVPGAASIPVRAVVPCCKPLKMEFIFFLDYFCLLMVPTVTGSLSQKPG